MTNPNLMVSSIVKSKKQESTYCKSCFRFLIETFCLGLFYLILFWFVLYLSTQFLYQQGLIITQQDWLQTMQQLTQQVQQQPLDHISIPQGIEMIQFVDNQATFSTTNLFQDIPVSFYYQNEGTLGSYYYQKFNFEGSTYVLLSQFPRYLANFAIRTDLRGWYFCILLSGSILICWCLARKAEKVILQQFNSLQVQLFSPLRQIHYQLQEFSDFATILISNSTSIHQASVSSHYEQGNEFIPSHFTSHHFNKSYVQSKSRKRVLKMDNQKQALSLHAHLVPLELHDFLHQTAQSFQAMADQHDVLLHCQSCRETVFVVSPLFQKTIQALVYQAISRSPSQSHVQIFAQINQDSWQIKITQHTQLGSSSIRDSSLPLAKQLIRQGNGTLLIHPTIDGKGSETILQFSLIQA